MRFTVELPQVGESVAEGIVARWLVKVGQSVQQYEPLAEIVTDKVTLELPSPVSGVVRQFLVEEGATVPVGTPILEIELSEEVESIPISARVGELREEARAVGPTGGGASSEVFDFKGPSEGGLAVPEAKMGGEPGTQREPHRYSPAVRRLAREYGVDLNQIPGTGLGGRVTKEDVLAFVAQKETSLSEEEPVRVSPIRRLIAENLTRSAREIPQAWAMVEVDVTGLVLYRKKIKEEFQRREGVKLSYLPFVIQAVVEGLKRYPILNARWREGEIILRRRIHVGIAVATERGLVVPVIRDADRLNLAGLARAVHELTERARQDRLTLEDVQGGTFTVNNTGALGVLLSRPIVPPDQAGILTMEAITRRLTVVSEEEELSGGSPAAFSIRFLMNMTLAFDHRILDGAEAAAFLRDVKQRLERFAPETDLSAG